MINQRYFISDFVEIQRRSFFELLKKGLIEEFSKRNPITSSKKDIQLVFYPEHYKLTVPEYNPRQAVIHSKSYTSKLYVPIQLIHKKSNTIRLKWAYVGNLPLMTKRGHFVLNGAARVIVNQIIRSPGIYYQEKLYETFSQKWSQKPETSYKRYYADLICLRGTWLRLEIDKEKNVWAQTKKGPKIPVFWFLIGMGLSERTIFNSILEPNRLVQNLGDSFKPETKQKKNFAYVKNPAAAWREIFLLLQKKNYISTAERYDETEVTNSPLVNHSNNKNLKSKNTILSDPLNMNFSDREKEFTSKNISNSENANLFIKSSDHYLRGFQNLKTENRMSQTTELTAWSSEQSSPTIQSVQTINEQFELPERKFILKRGFQKLNYLQTSKKIENRNLQESAWSLPTMQTGPTEQLSPTTELRVQRQFGDEEGFVKTLFPFKNKDAYTQADIDFQINSEQGRKWLFSKFMSPRSYDLGKQGRYAFNRKLGLKIDEKQLVLTPHDLLYATDYLIKVEKGLGQLDDIDHLKNRRVRTSGELIQIQIGIALVRLEKVIRDKINKTSLEIGSKATTYSTATTWSQPIMQTGQIINDPQYIKSNVLESVDQKLTSPLGTFSRTVGPNHATINNSSNNDFEDSSKVSLSLNTESENKKNYTAPLGGTTTALSRGFQVQSKLKKIFGDSGKKKTLTITNLINNKAFNSALREFFGTSPLSQFMDQINPLAEITHKRRLSSMGPGGVTRDRATLAIRGIHPTHYGRICPIETPEGKNTGLVNSMTAYARVNSQGMLESPFYKVYKGIVLQSSGMYYLSAEYEEKTKLAAADLFVTPIGFLPNTNIPVRIAENFTKIRREIVEYIGVSSLQMISIATSLIPFLEHDDANRALMGSNMQRQAVPLIRPERPIVGTGLEPRAVSDSGHVLQAKFSGVVTYVSAEKIKVTTISI